MDPYRPGIGLTAGLLADRSVNRMGEQLDLLATFFWQLRERRRQVYERMVGRQVLAVIGQALLLRVSLARHCYGSSILSSIHLENSSWLRLPSATARMIASEAAGSPGSGLHFQSLRRTNSIIASSPTRLLPSGSGWLRIKCQPSTATLVG